MGRANLRLLTLFLGKWQEAPLGEKQVMGVGGMDVVGPFIRGSMIVFNARSE